MTLSGIARRLDRPIATVHGWQSLGVEPRHADGERLLALWGERCAESFRDSEGHLG